MALGLHLQYRMRGSVIYWMIVIGLMGAEGCGKTPQIITPAPDAMKEVEGEATYGSQCPFGYVTDPKPVKLGLWDCPISLNKVQLAKPLQGLIVMADCHKKTLTLRTADRKIDTFWEVMPDGSFIVRLPIGEVFLKNDGSVGGGECVTYAELELWGQLKCTDRDQLIVQMDTIWWLGKEKPPSAPSYRLRACDLPVSCYLHGASEVPQCS